VQLLLLGYPSWVLFSMISLVPALLLVRWLSLNPWWAMPVLAVLTQLLLGAITHWPPTNWWPTHIVGGLPVPSGYLLGIPLEAWHAYLYSLWPNAFDALVAALSLLLAKQLLRPALRWMNSPSPTDN
jgi:hypothetical protein